MWVRHLSRFCASLRHRSDWRSRPRVRAARYVLKALSAPRLHARWVAVLFDDALDPVRRRDTRLFERWQHRWVSRHFSPRRKLRLLMDHYAYLPRLLGPDAVMRLGRGEPFDLAAATLKDGRELRVFLALPPLRCIEGELQIGLAIDRRRFFSMTITLCPDNGRVWIGCMQGVRSDTARDEIRAFTRACHGLRPKDLLLSMVRVVARRAGIPTIGGPGNRDHVFGRTDRVKACYDTFWLEAGASRIDGGLFETSAAEPVRNIAHVESKHRSAFRAREAVREDLGEQVAYALARQSSAALYRRKRAR